MHTIYVDESGELGFSSGSSKFFIVAMLSTEFPKKLANVMKKEKSKLYNKGWPRDLEIKGTSLYGSMYNNKVPRSISTQRIARIKQIIERIAGTESKFHYFIIDKSKLSPNLRASPYGVMYNIFSGQLAGEIYEKHAKSKMTMIVDRRSIETREWDYFNGYVSTKVVADHGYNGKLQIEHAASHKICGLQAVDLISWGLFRYFEHGDNAFKALIDPKCLIRHSL